MEKARFHCSCPLRDAVRCFKGNGLHSSRLSDSWCLFLFDLFDSDASKSNSVDYQVTLTACVLTSLLAPMAVIANAFVMAAIWKNPSLRTPSYVLLAGLAFTDFCTGLISQPFSVMYLLAELAGNGKIFCIAGVITQSVGYYLSSLTVIVMTLIAVERWLHMRRRSLLTVRRVVIIYITFIVLLIAFFAGHMYNWYYTNRFFSVFIVIFIIAAAICFFITFFAYFKVFKIIREHQNQVQTNQNAIDIEKFKKSVITILYILAIFLLSYVPFVCCLLVVSIMDEFGNKSSTAAFNACAAVAFSSSIVNPLLYYRRIKEIRDSVRSIIRGLCCKERREEGGIINRILML
ncbi:histamine H2 receptor-like [Oculina patagonica]